MSEVRSFADLRVPTNAVELSRIRGWDDSGWVALTLQNGWGNYPDATWADAAVRRFGGIVFVKGLISGGTVTSGTVVTTLPDGYRPASGDGYHLPAVSNDALTFKRVHPNGEITCGVGVSTTWLDISCCFPVGG